MHYGANCKIHRLLKVISHIPVVSFGRKSTLKIYSAKLEFSITQSDDWHLHLLDGGSYGNQTSKVKLYPVGATTNSQDGVTDLFEKCLPVLQEMVEHNMPLLVVMEHVTTMAVVKFVESCTEGFVAATVTPQHLVLSRNSLFQGGLQPHNNILYPFILILKLSSIAWCLSVDCKNNHEVTLLLILKKGLGFFS
ncbi:hypothetical protein RDI58_005026 [Solanum bulbocastanum]|uniref:Dihydroorotase n=1 Tax=Solanum bulbocastanum TaxID=147425 RepID=A0AAN8U2P8_SOLBU